MVMFCFFGLYGRYMAVYFVIILLTFLHVWFITQYKFSKGKKHFTISDGLLIWKLSDSNHHKQDCLSVLQNSPPKGFKKSNRCTQGEGQDYSQLRKIQSISYRELIIWKTNNSYTDKHHKRNPTKTKSFPVLPSPPVFISQEY